MNGLLTESLALLVAMVFAVAAVTKLSAWSELPGVIQNFRVLPRALALPAALVLPPLEMAAAVGILTPGTRAPAALTAALLFTVFGAALAINLHRGRRHIDCGCFRSALKQPLSAAVVVRNLVLAISALLLIPAGGDAMLSPLGWAAAGGGAVTLFFCYLSIGLVFRAPPPSYEENFHAPRATH